jgi:hypothetical protein
VGCVRGGIERVSGKMKFEKKASSSSVARLKEKEKQYILK